MTLYFGNSPISTVASQWKNPIEKFHELPQPSASNLQTEKFDNQDAVCILESEIAYCDLRTTKTRFFATTELVTCLFIYIFNDKEERLGFHYTYLLQLDWQSLFQKFKEKHNLKVVFVGASCKDQAYQSMCLKNIEDATKSLVDYFRTKRDFNVTVVGQQTLQANQVRSSDLPGLISIFVQHQLNEISLRIFGQPFLFPIDLVNPANNFPDRPSLFPIPGLGEVLFANLDILITQKLFKDKAQFPLTAQWIFSKSCYQELEKYYSQYMGTGLRDFALNLSNHKFFPVGPAKDTIPEYFLRLAHLSNFQFAPNSKPCLVYDNGYNFENMRFSQIFLEICRNHAKLINEHKKLSKDFKEFNIKLLKAFNYIDDNPESKNIYKSCEKRIVNILERFLAHQKSFQLACAFGNVDKVRSMLSMGWIDITYCDESQRTHLHYAVMRAPLVTDLLKKTIESRSTEDCLAQHPAIVRLLLGQPGIQANLKNSNGFTPLEIAERDAKEDNPKTNPFEKQIANEIIKQFTVVESLH